LKNKTKQQAATGRALFLYLGSSSRDSANPKNAEISQYNN